MYKTIVIASLATIVMLAGAYAVLPVQKAATALGGDRQSDHALALVDVEGAKVFCGVFNKEAWILRVTAAGLGVDGSVDLTFNDSDSISYPVLASSSFYAEYAFGGVPGVDNIVRVEGTDIDEMVVSAESPGGLAIDPFDENDNGIIKDNKDELDNFCVRDDDNPLTAEMDVEEGVGVDNTNAFGVGNAFVGVEDP
jgi:hypothetical protein